MNQVAFIVAFASAQIASLLANQNSFEEARIFENAPIGTEVTFTQEFRELMMLHRGCYIRVLGQKISKVPFGWDLKAWTLRTTGNISEIPGHYYNLNLGYFCASGTRGNHDIIIRVSKKNMHRPKFKTNHVTFYVPAAPIQDFSVFGTVEAQDNDVLIYSSKVSYTMLGSQADMFLLHENGSLSLRFGRKVSAGEKYSLIVKACDFGSPQKCSRIDVSVVIVMLTGSRNVVINTATPNYQIIEWEPPTHGKPLIYTIHIVPEDGFEPNPKSYQRSMLHHPGNLRYRTMTRQKLEPGFNYYVIVYSSNGEDNTPSHAQIINHTGIVQDVKCPGTCSPGGFPACFKNFDSVYVQFVSSVPQCICYPGYTGEQCSKIVTCKTERSRTSIGAVFWPETEINVTFTAMCPFGPPDNVLSRRCSLNEDNQAIWGRIRANGTDGCQSKTRLLTTLAMNNVMMFRKDGVLTSLQLHRLADTLEPLLPTAYADTEIAFTLISLISNVISHQWKDHTVSDSIRTRFLHMITSYAENAIPLNQGNTLELRTDNIIVSILDMHNDEELPNKFQFDIGKEAFLEVSLDVLAMGQIESGENVSRFRAIWMRNSTLYAVDNGELNYANPVMEIGFRNLEFLSGFYSPVRYRMKPYRGENKTYACVYYDYGERQWSIHGILSMQDVNHPDSVICEAYHMTGFSIVLDFASESPIDHQNQYILNLLSWIGCSVSIMGLAVTVITFSIFKCLHRDKAGQILINLCIAMLLLNVLFLASSLRPFAAYSRSSCTFIGAALHYLTLSALLWMGVEASHMYAMVVHVFATFERWFMLKRTIVAWGAPLIVVGVTLAVDSEFYFDKSDDYCRLSTKNGVVHYAAYLCPACLILLTNTIVFILVIIALAKSAKTSIRKASSLAENRKNSLFSSPTMIQVRSALTVMVLLGVTWVFGVFAVGPARLAFMYIFCILNSLQGFIIFLARCLFFEEARVAWEFLLKTGKLKTHRGKIVTGSLLRTTNDSRDGEVDTSTKKSILEIHQNRPGDSETTVQSESTEPLLLLSPKKIIGRMDYTETPKEEKSAGRRLMVRLTSWKFVDDPPSPYKAPSDCPPNEFT